MGEVSDICQEKEREARVNEKQREDEKRTERMREKER